MKGFFWISVFFAFSTVLLLAFGVFGLYTFSDGIPIGAGAAILFGFMGAVFTFFTGLGHYQDLVKELPDLSREVRASCQGYFFCALLSAVLTLSGLGIAGLFPSTNTAGINLPLIFFLTALITAIITVIICFLHFFTLKKALKAGSKK